MGKIIYLDNYTGGKAMLSVFKVARYILDNEVPNITHKKLQKLCYYVQAWYLAVFGKRFMDCEFEAWVHGPVCRQLYNECKLDINSVYRLDDKVALTMQQKNFLDLILKMYGEYTGNQLELLTHSEKPWQEAREGLNYWDSSNRVIKDDEMTAYYREELNREDN